MISRPTATDYGPARQPELEALVDNTAWAFGVSRERVTRWLTRAQLENIRVLRRSGRPVASLITVPMGQWFGGRVVSTIGVAAVATVPEARGEGAATALMARLMGELEAAKTPLSTLYPATFRLYRGAGYEVAGASQDIHFELSRIRLPTEGGQVRPATDGDQAAMAAAYRRQVRRANGPLDRGPYVWHTVRNPRWRVARAWVVEGEGAVDGGVAGYVFAVEERGSDSRLRLILRDLVATTPQAGRRLLAWVASHGTVARRATWLGTTASPLLALLPEQVYQAGRYSPWMIRLVEVPGALEARGYPKHLEGVVLDLAVEDDVLPGNSGRIRLQVARGRASVEPGGSGRLAIDVRGLAALYSSYLSPWDLQLAGLLTGPEAELEVASAIFAGPTPYMLDYF